MHCQKAFFYFKNPVTLTMRSRMQPTRKTVTVDKMTGIFTKHIWQP